MLKFDNTHKSVTNLKEKVEKISTLPINNIKIGDDTYKIVDINSSLRKKSEIDDLFSDKSEELVEDNDKTLQS